MVIPTSPSMQSKVTIGNTSTGAAGTLRLAAQTVRILSASCRFPERPFDLLMKAGRQIECQQRRSHMATAQIASDTCAVAAAWDFEGIGGRQARRPLMLWGGRVMSALPVLFLLFDGVVKLMNIAAVADVEAPGHSSESQRADRDSRTGQCSCVTNFGQRRNCGCNRACSRRGPRNLCRARPLEHTK
jgi:hypothetical protein